MKKIILSAIIICLALYGFTQNYNWGKTLGGKAAEVVTGCAADVNGNIYVTGYFRDTVDFDPGAGVFNLISNGSFDDVFVLKLDLNGQFVWAKKFGGASTDAAFAITTYGDDVFITGTFLDNIQFGSFSLTQNGTGTASFVCKLDSAGNVVWANAIKNQSGGTIRSQAITTNKNGIIYTTGYFNGTIENNSILYPADPGTLPGFIYKVDNDGSNSTLQTLLGSAVECRGIDIDNDNNIYVCGVYAGETDFDPGAGSMMANSVNFSRDIFVLKLATTTNNSWVRSIGIDGSMESANALAVDDSANVYFTGAVRDTVDFSGNSSIVLTTGSQRDSYVAKLNAQGETQWAYLIGNSDNQNGGQGLAIKIDPERNIYVGGNFGGKIDFDFGVDTFNMSTVFGGDDVYILKISSDAEFLWARRIGGENQSDKIGGIAIQDENSFFVAGTFMGTTKLDPMGGSSPIVANSNSFEDAFIIKYANSVITSESDEATNLKAENIKVYPNPTTQTIFIDVTEEAWYYMYNLQGELVKTDNITQKGAIDLSNFVSGLYLINIKKKNSSRVVKIMKL